MPADCQGMRAKAGRNVATVRQSTGTVLVYGCGESIHQQLNLKQNEAVPSVRVEKGRGIVLQYPVCSVLNCAISLGREGPGSCFTTTGLLSINTLTNVSGQKTKAY